MLLPNYALLKYPHIIWFNTARGDVFCWVKFYLGNSASLESYGLNDYIKIIVNHTTKEASQVPVDKLETQVRLSRPCDPIEMRSIIFLPSDGVNYGESEAMISLFDLGMPKPQ